MARNLYTLTPLTGNVGQQTVEGHGEAIKIAREIAESQYTTVRVRNETNQAVWDVSFRVRGNRTGGAYTTVEVTR